MIIQDSNKYKFLMAYKDLCNKHGCLFELDQDEGILLQELGDPGFEKLGQFNKYLDMFIYSIDI